MTDDGKSSSTLKNKNKIGKIWHVLIPTFGFGTRPSNYISNP